MSQAAMSETYGHKAKLPSSKQSLCQLEQSRVYRFYLFSLEILTAGERDFLFKFLVIGNAGTGKSCLLHQFIEKKFKDDSNHTIGVEFGSKIINVGGKYVKLQIWDTAGQERFSRETYNALTNWLTDARMLASQNIVIILCGNKKDLDADREVTFLEASRFAQENELMFLETSALTGENVEEAFVQCARKILNKIESGELDPERMGSGIQYGDAALRQLRSPRRAQAQSAQECGSNWNQATKEDSLVSSSHGGQQEGQGLLSIPTHSLKPHQLPVSPGHSKLPAVPRCFDTQKNEILAPTTSTQDQHVFRLHQKRQEPQACGLTPRSLGIQLALSTLQNTHQRLPDQASCQYR
ncbi:Ras-related protein Rab-4 [Aix galericulata]|nr:Ras-related protein Rab-4 [Aix galericulata]